MINNKDVKIYKNRIKNYDLGVSEKEVETEFYNFIKKYYDNKYTVVSEGHLNYTAPYNIDGLLEVRTLDTDYRILVEAKAGRNYSNSKNRNEVLAQAIYYCRKLNQFNELPPAVILLLERKSLIVIKTEDLKDLINIPYNGGDPSMAYKKDESLMEKLTNMNYDYNLYNFNDKTDYNKIFDLIDEHGHESEYKITKSRDFTADNNMIVFNEFTEKHNNIKYHLSDDYKYVSGKWYFYDNLTKKWNVGDTSIARRLLFDFVKVTDYRLGKLDFNILMDNIKDYYTVSDVRYIKFNNCMLDITNGKPLPFDEKYFYTNELNCTFNDNDTDNFNFLSFNGLINQNKNIFIKTDKRNYAKIVDLCSQLNLSISHFNRHDGEAVTVFDESEKLRFTMPIETININDFIIEECNKIIDFKKLCTLLANNNHYTANKSIINTKYFEEWNENNDLFLAWFNECLTKKEDSYIILQDAFESFNNWLTKRGNSKISLRYFISSFTTHKTFYNNKIVYKKKQYISKNSNRSIYYDENNNFKTTGTHENIFMNIAFS